MNHLWLPGVFQFLARSLKRTTDGADGRIIENTYRNKPKNKQQPHATPPARAPGGILWRQIRTGIGSPASLSNAASNSYCWAGLLAKLTDAGA